MAPTLAFASPLASTASSPASGLMFGLSAAVRVFHHLDGAWSVSLGDDDEGDISNVVSATEYYAGSFGN